MCAQNALGTERHLDAEEVRFVHWRRRRWRRAIDDTLACLSFPFPPFFLGERLTVARPLRGVASQWGGGGDWGKWARRRQSDDDGVMDRQEGGQMGTLSYSNRSQTRIWKDGRLGGRG